MYSRPSIIQKLPFIVSIKLSFTENVLLHLASIEWLEMIAVQSRTFRKWPLVCVKRCS